MTAYHGSTQNLSLTRSCQCASCVSGDMRWWCELLKKHAGSRNLLTCVPSLADLSKLLLKRVLREDGAPHDCKEDAIAAVQLAKHLMQHGPTLVLDPPNVKVHLQQTFSRTLLGTSNVPAKGRICLKHMQRQNMPSYRVVRRKPACSSFFRHFIEDAPDVKHIKQAVKYTHVSAGSQGAAVQAAGAFSAARCGRG